MKKLILFFIASATLLFACTQKDPNQVTVTGKVTNPIGETADFIAADTTFSTNLMDDGTFEIDFVIDSAQYISFRQGQETTAMYILPGDEIHLTIDTEMYDETITYTGSPASTFLADKYMMQEKGDFFGELYYLGSPEEYKASLDKFKENIAEKLNTFTDSGFINDQKEELEQLTSYYIRRQKQQAEKLKDFGDDVRMYIMKKDLLDREANLYGNMKTMDLETFTTALKEYQETLTGNLKDITDKEYVKKQLSQIEKTVKHWADRKDMVEAVPKAGEDAIGFSYPDKDGNEFSLSSFEGKLVYVDVWATWCGPCKAEIPYLKQLEADYHEKEIVFVSISTDSDREAWLKMIEEKEMGGVQLYAGSEWGENGMTGISRDYAIFGIPRFMLFSKDGIVISNDAPRPSSTEIRSMIDENL